VTWKRLVCIGSAAVLIAATAVGWALADHSPYAFLNQFHPSRFEDDLSDLNSVNPSMDVEPHVTILFFRNQDADAVLSSMKAEYSLAHGYLARKVSFDKELSKDIIWEFSTHALLRGDCTTLRAGACAQFLYGKSALNYIKGPSPPEGACVVIVPYHQTWAEKAMESVRRFLHLRT
jgi:hypothetical protein